MICKKYYKYCGFTIAILLPIAANANTYNTNSSIQIKSIISYTNSSRIYIEPKTRPSGISCAGIYFEISESTTDAARQNVMSRLLVAYTTGESITIGYDNLTCTPSGNIATFRVG